MQAYKVCLSPSSSDVIIAENLNQAIEAWAKLNGLSKDMEPWKVEHIGSAIFAKTILGKQKRKGGG